MPTKQPYDPGRDDDAVTPEVPNGVAATIRREVQREGGRAHDFAHADREVVMPLPGKLSGKLKPTAVPLCTCGRALVVSVPQIAEAAGVPGLKLEGVRACIQCDALPSWPRYNDGKVV